MFVYICFLFFGQFAGEKEAGSVAYRTPDACFYEDFEHVLRVVVKSQLI